MAEDENNENNNGKPTLDLSKPPPEPAKPPRVIPKRTFKIDKPKLVDYILKGFRQNQSDGEDRKYRRLARYDKLNLRKAVTDDPWEGAACFPVPTMRTADLKTRGVLENALKSSRPLAAPKARQRRNQDKQEQTGNLLDYQFFTENKGEKIIDDIVAKFVQDETVFVSVQWVKEEQPFHDTRLMGPLDPSASVDMQLMQFLKVIYGGDPPDYPNLINAYTTGETTYEWEVIYMDGPHQRISKCCFYQRDDGQIEAVTVTMMPTFDGPAIKVKNFEDIVYPIRSANLQPPSNTNPDGAPYYDELFTFNLDVCKRRMVDGTYDQLTEEDFEKVAQSKSDVGSGSDNEEIKEQQDNIEGSYASQSDKREDRLGIKRFGRFDVNGDGLDEDIIAWVAVDAKVLLKVSLLTEHYPGLPIRRPIVHDSFVPNPDRVIGMSQAELMEVIQDPEEEMFNDHVNWGKITNTPMGFYRAASGLKGEPIQIRPGILIPVDNPGGDVIYPPWPTKDSMFALNTMTVLQQYREKLEMAGDTSYGRIQQGKASALRTAGTTAALVGATNERSEMILRRLGKMISDVYLLMHLLNRRFLPKEKEIRVQGLAEQGKEAYTTVKPEQIDCDMDFEFPLSMIDSNKDQLAMALQEAMPVYINPLMVQLGIVDQEKIYNLVRDWTKAKKLDPDKYSVRPFNPMPGPKLSSEEAISAAIAGDPLAMGGPLENPQEHLMKLQMYLDAPPTVGGIPQQGFTAFSILGPSQKMALLQWANKVMMLLQQQMMLAQAVGGFQQAGGQGGESAPGGTPSTISTEGTTMGSNPPLENNEKIDESIGGVQ